MLFVSPIKDSLTMHKFIHYLLILLGLFAKNEFSHAQTNQVGFGVVFATPEQLSRVPVAVKYRGYLPPSADLSKRMLPPGTQGTQSSCVAWAVGYSAESYYTNAVESNTGRSRFTGSPAFIYNQLTPDKYSCKSGTVVTDALALLRQQGIPSMSEFPYREDSCSAMPTAEVREFASRHRIHDFHRIQSRDIEAVKSQVYSGHPVIFAMKVPQSFLDHRGSVVYRDMNSSAFEGHAMVVVGYDDNKSAFRVINSWGSWWGDNGYAWVDYQTTMYRSEEFYVFDPGFQVKKADDYVEPQNNPPPVVVTPNIVLPVIKVNPVIKPVEVIPKVVVSNAEIKQKINEIGSSLQCSHTETTVSDAGDVVISGYVKDMADLNKLRIQVKAIPGVNSVSTKISINPWPICEVNQTLGNAHVSTAGVKVEIPDHSNGVLKKGEQVNIQVKTTKASGYLYLTYLQANGEAVELMWGQKVPADSLVKLAGRLEISEPFGQEMLIAIVSPKPLFASSNGVVTDRRFLSSIRETLTKLNQEDQKKVVVNVLPIKTLER